MTQFKRLSVNKNLVIGLVAALIILLFGVSSYLTAGKDTGKGYLGVMVENLSQEDMKDLGLTHGVRVTKAIKDQAAEKAGIKKGDIIQYFNDEKIRKPDDLVDAVRDCKPDTQVKVKLVREGKNQEVTVTLGKLKSQFQWFGLEGDKGFLNIFGGAYLGVHLQELNNDLGEYFGVKEKEGALILKVEEDSPAEKAGLKAGDVIVKVDKKEIKEPNDVIEALSDFEKGDKVDIQILRHKQSKNLQAELDERKGFGGIGIFKGGIKGGIKGGAVGGICMDEFPLHIYLNLPHQTDEDVIILEKKYRDKIEKQMKQAKEKMEEVKEKLKNLKPKEYIYI